jgi:hypothetical protein
MLSPIPGLPEVVLGQRRIRLSDLNASGGKNSQEQEAAAVRRQPANGAFLLG